MRLRNSSSLLFATIVLVAMLAGVAGAQSGPAEITVIGSGVLQQPARILIVTVGVGVVGPTAAEARERVGLRTDEFLKEFRQFGLTPDDWAKTTAVQRRAIPEEPKKLAFWATTTLAVRLDEFGAATDMLDRATDLNVASIDFEFVLDDPQLEYERALKRALADAQFKADMLAKETGVKLGSMLGCEELTLPPILEAASESRDQYSGSGPGGRNVPAARRAADLSPHEIVTIATVRARYAIAK